MKATLIIDMQKAYFNDPKLATQQEQLVKNINAHLKSQPDAVVINVITLHKKDKSTWTLNMLEDDAGFLFQSTDETRLVEGLELDDCIEITKTRDSAFFGTELAGLIKKLDITELYLTGVLAHTCVFHTASDAYAHNLPVSIVKDAVGDTDSSLMDTAMKYLQTEYRQRVV